MPTPAAIAAWGDEVDERSRFQDTLEMDQIKGKWREKGKFGDKRRGGDERSYEMVGGGMDNN
jgi:hypothetical protein